MGGTENIGAIIILINNFHVKLSSLNLKKKELNKLSTFSVFRL